MAEESESESEGECGGTDLSHECVDESPARNFKGSPERGHALQQRFERELREESSFADASGTREHGQLARPKALEETLDLRHVGKGCAAVSLVVSYGLQRGRAQIGQRGEVLVRGRSSRR